MSENKPFQWLKERSAGVLLHPTSLPGEHGIGVLGPQALGLVDFMREAGIRYWQVLPLGPTGFGDSPYSSYSAYAGNPFLVDLVPLTELGILKVEDLEPLKRHDPREVDYPAMYRVKWPLLRLAHKRFVEQKRAYLPNFGLFKEFKQNNAAWMEPFCAFMALKERFSGAFWGEWPEACRTLHGAMNSPFWAETEQAREAHAFFQYLFFGQWRQIREYANAAGIEVIGDIPIFVALDSADAWATPEIFQMSKPGQPDFVAGVPPDYFSATGQLWGNPLYDWEVLKKDKYAWWIRRLEANFALFDVIRLDHFRGFYDYWKIPAGAKDARSGSWVDGPQDLLFREIEKRIPGARLIAEDLGEIHESVRAFRDRLGLPGMAILQFAFGSGSDNLYLPHNLVRNSVVYPGTHDNDTTCGWYDAASPELQDHIRRYLRVDGRDISWDLIRWAYQSVSNLTVIPMQDFLARGTEARMNQPGTGQGNWKWRMTAEEFANLRYSEPYLRDLGLRYGRQAPEPASPEMA